jgi:hypothetical protein
MEHSRIKLDTSVIFAFVIIAALGMLWGNAIYMLVCFVSLFSILYLCWFRYQPPVLLFILVYHWVQVFFTVLIVNYTGNDINYNSSNAGVAVILCLIGILIMTIVFRVQSKKIKFATFPNMKKAAEELSSTNVLILYIIFYVLTNFLNSIAFSLSGFTQIIFSFMQLKWALFSLFALICIIKREKYIFLAVIIAFEFISGLYSYFSTFKDVLFYIILIVFTFIAHIKFKHFISAFILSTALFAMAVYWQSLKSDYRAYLRQDVQEQVINVSQSEAFDKLLELSDRRGWYEFNATILTVLTRIGYTYHFQLVLDRIPSRMQHTDGALWLSNLEFVFTPRLLNPNKPVLDASTKTNKYAGTGYATAAMGASFSLGYFVEGYIDFGIWGMFFPILIISFILGFFYRYFLTSASTNLLLNYSLSYSIFIPFFSLESDAIFFVGRLAITIITFFLLKYALIRWSLPFLRRINK